MVVKTITVTQDAYQAIKGLKHGDESFSDLFLRVGKRGLTVKDAMGVLKLTPKESDELAERVRNVRKGLNKEFEERRRDIRSRLERSD